jgi:8-hydroxy-5-deazaflavin:NADPH oxidoreductase
VERPDRARNSGWAGTPTRLIAHIAGVPGLPWVRINKGIFETDEGERLAGRDLPRALAASYLPLHLNGKVHMRIGVIGAGRMGAILARHLAKRGHHVSIANSRGPESLTALAAEIGATPVSVGDAAKAGEIVIIAIPTKAVADLPRTLFAEVPSSVVVIDIGNYHPELRDGRIDAIDRGMLDSQWVAQQIGRPVTKAFNNILAKSLLENGVPRGTKRRIALSVFGDSLDTKTAVLRLVDDLGFDPVDGGDLDDSWRQQPGTPAYCQDLEAAALRRALAEADRSRIAEYRAEREARIRRDIAAQTPSGLARQGGSHAHHFQPKQKQTTMKRPMICYP